MLEALPNRLADLLEIACYVYCVDQFTRRDTPDMKHMGAAWRRDFRRHPELAQKGEHEEAAAAAATNGRSNG
jgi:hypothetical protein